MEITELTSGDYPDGLVIPQGEIWQLRSDEDVLITSSANIVVEGMLISMPDPTVTHEIRFQGISNQNFVGGGVVVREEDVGIWVTGLGQLHLQGTYREAWNRTGDHPSWQDDDELWSAPSGFDMEGEPLLDPTRYVRGEEIDVWEPRQVAYDDGKYARSYTNEVFNLTRNMVLSSEGEGRAHLIFLHCERPQHLGHVLIKNFGPRKPEDSKGYDGIIGRYPVHFHHCHDGVRGSVVNGVVVRGSHNRAFVPHASNGIFFNDCIAWSTKYTPFWWDHGPDSSFHSHNITFNHCAAVRITWKSQGAYTLNGFMLNGGIGNSIVDSVVTGSRGVLVNGGAFHWPSQMNTQDSRWHFENNVAHNNRGNGIGVWQNTSAPHTIGNCVSYNNGESGIAHGAYDNRRWRYFQNVAFGNLKADVTINAVGNSEFLDNDFGRVHISHHFATRPNAETVLSSGRGWKIDRVSINEKKSGSSHFGKFRFKSEYFKNNLVREDFSYDPSKVYSDVYVDNDESMGSGTAISFRIPE